MTTTTVTTQSELDAALLTTVSDIIIDSPSGVWLRLDSNGKGSSRVEAWGSSSVEAWGSSRVVAWGSSSVVAWDSSRVEAWGSSRVEASKYVAIHLHSKRVSLSGSGVIIDVTDINTHRVPDFIDYYGVTVTDGWATVYKAVDDDLKSGRHFAYPIGATVTAPDWKPTQECGAGLHFGHRPAVARDYFREATRFLECQVEVASMVALGDKVKAESCRVVREVDIHGDAVAPVKVVSA